ncbi:hypothetical protein L249_3965 [Ophiocordyceps polyrhachis-furcata BCC 54312]|uniref:Helicase ATP-binding domain-containing protein n=1 Tax=Ophiocordyceps polyrhachis-furcata BCC 54312 TaxID=1330021 RepID=A0A367L4Z1_9HYPO|nr:hypothetical protein L249_3965 [Ophiocordyceps polyrhachis-furcata BCC 54312]
MTSSEVDSVLSGVDDSDTPPSSPPVSDDHEAFIDDALLKEELVARNENEKVEEQRLQTLARRRNKKKKKPETKAEREAKARELDELLVKSAAFSDILTKKTNALGRVGSSLDGKTLGEHDLVMAKQPTCMVNGTMHQYQLEGLTWMFEICAQGMSGILADEMGLGKTVQTIALIALLREQENYLGPHLIVAPLSTLGNWENEFRKWTPSIPVLMYHGDKKRREDLYKSKIAANLSQGRPNAKFPIVLTSYEMVLRDQHHLSRVNWEFIIIVSFRTSASGQHQALTALQDEGHRMKNAEAKLFQQLRQFSSATRLLITGTPLQNNLKELWSLLHFLLPNIFTDWDAFESWFDFSDLEDEQSTAQFIGDRQKHEIVKKMHLILQPLLLRRIKQDVAAYLPKKREYVLFAPMTREQTDLYNAFTDKSVDTRAYLEKRAVQVMANSLVPAMEALGSAKRSTRTTETPASRQPTISSVPNAFSMMMAVKQGQPSKSAGIKRKGPSTATSSAAKSVKSSRASTPAGTRGRGRMAKSYAETNPDEEDKLSDDAFEERLAREMGRDDQKEEEMKSESPEEALLTQSLELARKQIAHKKLGNTLAQLRLVCNSPHNFYNPWGAKGDLAIDESIVTASGKMLLLDRLLPRLFRDGHKVLIFSQFVTQLDILEDYCSALRGWPVCRIDGSVAQTSRQQQISDFNARPDYNIFLLSTRAGGQGINLAAADTVILFDSDFNPQQDLQAQDRCHRIGQTRPVLVYRLATRDTVEESLLSSADAKRRLEKLVIQNGAFHKKMQQQQQTQAKDDVDDDDDDDALRALLLKDGLVYDVAAPHVLADQDLDALCDRSEEAYDMAAKGLGDADLYRVVETRSDSITLARKT